MDGDFVTTDIRLIDRYKNGISHHKNTFDWQLLRGGFVTTKLCFIDRYFSRGGSHYRNTLDWQIWKGILHHRNTLDWQVWVADALPQKYAWLTGMNEGCTSPQKYAWETDMKGGGYVSTGICLSVWYKGVGRHQRNLIDWQVWHWDTSPQKYGWLTGMNGKGLRHHKIMLYWQVLRWGGIRHYRNTFDWQIWKGEYVITGICFIDRYDKGILHHNL